MYPFSLSTLANTSTLSKKILIKCHLLKPYYSCIIKGLKIPRSGTFSHMLTVSGDTIYCTLCTAPCHLQVTATKQHKNIIITGQEINTHKINKYITSSDL